MKANLLFSVILFLGLTFVSCEKEKGKTGKIEVEFKFTETIEIINSEYSIEIYGYDPNWMDVPATLITHQQFQSTKVPFTVKIKIPKNAADSIEHINNKANAKYYLNIEWDSDGNGKKCNGDISIDFNTKFPEISLESNEKQIIFLKKLTSSTPCI